MNEADPRVRRTRKLLQQALMDLLAEKSFHSINVQDVVERATVNRATFYAHFPDKYALLDYVVGDWFREELKRAGLDSIPFNESNLRRLIATVLTVYERSTAAAGPEIETFSRCSRPSCKSSWPNFSKTG